MRVGRAGWLVPAGVLVGLAGGLATCENRLQDERVALCRRVLPALVPEADATVLRAGTGATGDSVRLDYRVGQRPHALVCRFDGGAALAGVSLDGASMSGPRLFFLRRYYLDDPEGSGAAG